MVMLDDLSDGAVPNSAKRIVLGYALGNSFDSEGLRLLVTTF